MSERRRDILREAVAELRNECPIRVPREAVERVSKSLHGYLYDGSFASKLGTLDLFSKEQAEASSRTKREERELEIEQVLLHYLNPSSVVSDTTDTDTKETP